VCSIGFHHIVLTYLSLRIYSLDRAGVVSRYNALFSDSMVSPAEGAPMKAVFTTIRSRAQGQ